ncbi:MAG TPA: DUF167 domain-containing protein, partial [Rhodospirillales bacterium]|nr:DUF167 domain-containing protein [Rhodospirillales bacterium]
KAMIKLLAQSWRLPKTALSVKKGATGQRKTLLIDAPVAELLKRVDKNS